jgi:hypothetical protein
MAKCGECTYYRPVSASAGAGWCQCDAMQVAVVADWEACEDFKRGTSLMDTKTVTIALERHEELIKAEERLAVIKTITNQPHPYDHDKIRLIQAILEDKQCEITSETI